MSSSGKKLTTDQHIFGRWMRTESIMRSIDDLVKDLVSLSKRKIHDREDKRDVRDAVDALEIAKARVSFARKALGRAGGHKAKAKAKPRKPAAPKYAGPWARFSVEKAAEGGQSFKDAKESLEAAGITPVRRGHSPYVGQYGLEVPERFEDKASDILFGA